MSSTTKTSGKSTFGVELEFLALVPGDYNFTPHHAIYEFLQEKVTLPCPFNCQQGNHDLRLPVDAETPAFWAHNDDLNEYKTWVVTRDCSVKLTRDEKLLYPDDSVVSDVEFPSRILDFHNPSPCPHGQVWPCNGQPLMWDWRDEITVIINTLKQRMNKPGYRVFCNDTCGMHVHIGRDKVGFNLNTTKNIMGMFAAWERCFDSVLTVDRIAGYENDHAALPALKMDDTDDSIDPWQASPGWKYNLPLSVRQFEHLGHDLMVAYSANDYFQWDKLNRNGASIPYWLHRIYETTSFASLGEYSTAHQSSVNLEHVVHKDTKKPTIEIRLHQGTLEIPEICSWIDVLVNISSYAETNSCASVLATLESSYANPSLTIIDIAKLVSASASTIAHYTCFLSPTYSFDLFDKIVSSQPEDSLSALYAYNARNTSSRTQAPAISTRISQKLVSGRYGQFPVDFLSAVLPEKVKKVAKKDVRFLSDELDAKGLEEWSAEVENVVGKVVERKNGSGGYY
ncbi:unnamed protein product [Aureobasidium uvarum]|uniref:Amidoligase enzyme n=1 Tax=Aureobasidium uvarum TaxID=2773716 RepID=A0A9N8KI09_9PEZI|nr:unnamed protein product [Aureobasidium uvarum]